MNNKITNPYLKQLISEIASKTNQGRVVGLSWETLSESKKNLKKEADEKEKEKDAKGSDTKELPPLEKDKAPEGPKDLPSLGDEKKSGEPFDKLDAEKGMDAKSSMGDTGADKGNDTEEAQADAVKAKAELEKAKAEKDQAEKEIKKHSYVKLGSGAGTQFLLGKILDHAFKTNTIDALAGEMVQKLKIATPEDISAFSEETAAYRVIPGFPELLASMKTMATKTKEEPAKEPAK